MSMSRSRSRSRSRRSSLSMSRSRSSSMRSRSHLTLHGGEQLVVPELVLRPGDLALALVAGFPALPVLLLLSGALGG